VRRDPAGRLHRSGRRLSLAQRRRTYAGRRTLLDVPSWSAILCRFWERTPPRLLDVQIRTRATPDGDARTHRRPAGIYRRSVRSVRGDRRPKRGLVRLHNHRDRVGGLARDLPDRQGIPAVTTPRRCKLRGGELVPVKQLTLRGTHVHRHLLPKVVPRRLG